MVAVADVPDQRLQLWAVDRALAGLLLSEGLVALPHRFELPREVLASRRNPEVGDALSQGPMCVTHVLDPSRDMCQKPLLDPVEQERYVDVMAQWRGSVLAQWRGMGGQEVVVVRRSSR
ncbi:hypothetical protein GCM10023160_16580 [Brachybacterium paraconglomeratum]